MCYCIKHKKLKKKIPTFDKVDCLLRHCEAAYTVVTNLTRFVEIAFWTFFLLYHSTKSVHFYEMAYLIFGLSSFGKYPGPIMLNFS
jgi:hypothetical protein